MRPFGQFGRELGQHDEAREDEGAGHHQEDRARGVDCLQHAIDQIADRHRARGEADHDREERGHGGGLGRREPAEINAEHRDEKQKAKLPHSDRGPQPLPPRHRRHARDPFRLEPRHRPHRHHIQPGEHEAGNEGGGVELHQRDFCHDRIDRGQHRGRDQDAQRAGGRDRAGRESGVVAVPPHFRDRHARKGRGGCDRGAADRTEQGAGADAGIGQRTADAGKHRIAGLEQFARHPGARRHRPHQDEQRDHRQRIGAGHLERHEAGHLQRRLPSVDCHIAEEA